MPRTLPKRQRTGALQDLAECPTSPKPREASWTAVVLYRFPLEPAEAKDKVSPVVHPTRAAKAPEDWRTPQAGGFQCGPAALSVSWSVHPSQKCSGVWAAVLCRFSPNKNFPKKYLEIGGVTGSGITPLPGDRTIQGGRSGGRKPGVSEDKKQPPTDHPGCKLRKTASI